MHDVRMLLRRCPYWLYNGSLPSDLAGRKHHCGLNHLLNPVDSCFCSDNYVVINGRCYTDIHKVRSMALEALQEVATPTDEYFPEVDLDEADRVIIDNQLDELRSLFDDNE